MISSQHASNNWQSWKYYCLNGKACILGVPSESLSSYYSLIDICHVTRYFTLTVSISNTTPMKRRPTHPGTMLREDFMPDYDLTVAKLAEAVGVSRQSVNELLRERRGVSPEMALRLSQLFGNSAEFWLNAQQAVDLWDAKEAIRDELAGIRPLRAG